MKTGQLAPTDTPEQRLAEILPAQYSDKVYHQVEQLLKLYSVKTCEATQGDIQTSIDLIVSYHEEIQIAELRNPQDHLNLAIMRHTFTRLLGVAERTAASSEAYRVKWQEVKNRYNFQSNCFKCLSTMFSDVNGMFSSGLNGCSGEI